MIFVLVRLDAQDAHTKRHLACIVERYRLRLRQAGDHLEVEVSGAQSEHEAHDALSQLFGSFSSHLRGPFRFLAAPKPRPKPSRREVSRRDSPRSRPG